MAAVSGHVVDEGCIVPRELNIRTDVVQHKLMKGDVNDHECPGNEEECHATVAKATCTVDRVDHKHGPSCGHEIVPHDDHIDYFVGGRFCFPR